MHRVQVHTTLTPMRTDPTVHYTCDRAGVQRSSSKLELTVPMCMHYLVRIQDLAIRIYFVDPLFRIIQTV